MKNNKNLNVKVSVLILSVYCFMGSVEILKAPPVHEGKAPEKSGEHEGSTGGEHTGTHAGEPPVGAKSGSKPTESGKSGKESDSSSDSKSSGKEEGLHLDEEAPSEEVSAGKDVKEVSKEEAAPKEEAPAPKAETAKMSTEEMAKELLEEAKAIKPDDIQAVEALMEKIGKMDSGVTDDVLNQLKDSLTTEEVELTKAIDENAKEIQQRKKEFDDLVKQSSKWILKDGELINPTTFTEKFTAWLEPVRALFDSAGTVKLESAKKTYLEREDQKNVTLEKTQTAKKEQLADVQKTASLFDMTM